MYFFIQPLRAFRRPFPVGKYFLRFLFVISVWIGHRFLPSSFFLSSHSLRFSPCFPSLLPAKIFSGVGFWGRSSLSTKIPGGFWWDNPGVIREITLCNYSLRACVFFTFCVSLSLDSVLRIEFWYDVENTNFFAGGFEIILMR